MKPNKLILIGASTGGPGEIVKIINELPILHDTSVIVAQHMPETFLINFAKSLKNKTANQVSLVTDGMKLLKAKVYVLSNSAHIQNNSDRLTFKSTKDNCHYNPDI
ncbi:chemotaxis protein CheB, partial [Sulfurimonas sp. MAG313]